MAEKIEFSINIKWLVVALLVTNLLTIFFWKPWATETDNKRTISVSGSTTIEAEPDQYQFYPTWEFTGDDNDAVNSQIAEKSNEVVDGLKDQGVEDSSIKVNANNYNYEIFYDRDDDQVRGYLSIQVKLTDKDLAQKVQDYLLTTAPQGSITPNVTFSQAKQKQLEEQARSQAIADAKVSAERTATELEVKLGKVVSVADEQGYQFPWAYGVAEDTAILRAEGDEGSSPSIGLQPGQNEFSFRVKAVFEVK